MDLRDRIAAATKDAMKARDAARLSTLRLIGAGIKDRDIAARSEPGAAASGAGAATGGQGVGDDDLIALLSKMVKQRQESARAFEEGGRIELAEREMAEMKVIQEFLPRQLDPTEVAAAVDKAVADLGAGSVRDMGRVMGELRARHAGQMDFGAVGALVKARLMG